MKKRNTPWFLVALLTLWVVACGSETDTNEPSGDADATENDATVTPDGSVEPDAGVAPDTGDAPDATEPDVEADAGGGECLEPGAECGDSDTCCGGDCIFGICTIDCDDDADCRRIEPECFRGQCAGGNCRFLGPLDGPLESLDEPGDCSIPYCVLDGTGTSATLELRPDNTDLPPDDGIDCTVEQCQEGQPTSLPDATLCEDDDPDTFFQCRPSEGGCVEGRPPSWYCPPVPLIVTDPAAEGYVEETCGDGQDNNGDGEVDEGCPCTYGDVQRCWSGPPEARGVGGCSDGTQVCGVRADPRWGPCEDQIIPQPEACDNKDNDCNGCVDDLDNCLPVLTCPVEEFALPFAFHELNAVELIGSSDDIATVKWYIGAPTNSELASGGPADDPATTDIDESHDVVDDPNTPSLDESLEPISRVFLDVSGDYVVTADILTRKNVRIVCSWVVRARGAGLRVELKWTITETLQSDLDLHLHQEAETDEDYLWFQRSDAYFNNQRPSWGYGGTLAEECGAETNCNNPRLDIDNQGEIIGRPENVNLDNPRDGDTFRVMVHAWRLSEFEPQKEGVVTIFCGGEQAAVLGARPDSAILDDDFMWLVADVTMEVDEDGRTTGCGVRPRFTEDGGWDIFPRNVELPE